jgi:hypothetical protein
MTRVSITLSCKSNKSDKSDLLGFFNVTNEEWKNKYLIPDCGGNVDMVAKEIMAVKRGLLSLLTLISFRMLP